MRRLGLAFSISFLLLALGCAGHFYRVHAGRLDIYLRNDRAAEVRFASSLDGFILHRVEKVGDGTWRISIPQGGEFRYFYRIDGKAYLPDCRYRERDDFGSYNCLYKPAS